MSDWPQKSTKSTRKKVAIVNEEIVKNESDEIDEGHTGRRV
jgi:hypothetical protein